jgi:sugar phosphate isomerase/epimerase
MILAAKSAPDTRILSMIQKAGINAVELHLSPGDLRNIRLTKKTCAYFDFQYAVHSPNSEFEPLRLAELVDAIGAKIVVFHDIYWEDEWAKIARAFKKVDARLCVENTHSVHEPVKLMRRFGVSRCVDVEHLQMECGGVYAEEFIKVFKQASHIHLTGYKFGGTKWHTHIHHSPRHGKYLMKLLEKAGYSGFVVSEARVGFQAYREFNNLAKFWKGFEARSGF